MGVKETVSERRLLYLATCCGNGTNNGNSVNGSGVALFVA
jgi:hypothetical protein